MRKQIRFKWYLVAAIINIMLDSALTSYALDNGFYETNPFTNTYGLMFHMLILLVFVIATAIMGDIAQYELQRNPNKVSMFMCWVSSIILMVFNWIWAINNWISITLLVAM